MITKLQIRRIVRDNGGRIPVSFKLKTRPQTVGMWMQRGIIPHKYALAFANMAGIDPYKVRPDVFAKP